MSKIYQCADYPAQCDVTEYPKFDELCRLELASPVSAHEIINESTFCMPLYLDHIRHREDDELDLNDYLGRLNGKVGLYHLWADVGHCQDHDTHLLVCGYVGKGHVKLRVISHTENKWHDETDTLYVTFYECENRIAKYLEQLFLDNYEFPLNTVENHGKEKGFLFARWTEERYTLGTEIQFLADRQTEKDGGIFE